MPEALLSNEAVEQWLGWLRSEAGRSAIAALPGYDFGRAVRCCGCKNQSAWPGLVGVETAVFGDAVVKVQDGQREQGRGREGSAQREALADGTDAGAANHLPEGVGLADQGDDRGAGGGFGGLHQPGVIQRADEAAERAADEQTRHRHAKAGGKGKDRHADRGEGCQDQ